MTYFDLCKEVSGYKTSDAVHKFCSYASWYCIYNKLEFNKHNVKEAHKKYLKTPKE